MGRSWKLPALFLLPLLASALSAPAAAASSLDEELGRSEVRVYSRAYRVPRGRTVVEAALPQRLERLGYRRVRGRRPASPGEYFWGHEVFWIYRREHRLGGRRVPAELVGLTLARPDGRILGPRAAPGAEAPSGLPRLEPETLAESLTGDRAPRRPVRLDDLPEHVWRALLAIEDARFLDHPGVDYRSVARALWANLRAGRVTQGGSTITQQLVKMRQLTPRRTLGRKLSEAVRALALETTHDKREILESYLNHVYYGHVDGVAVHGIGAAARAFFGRPARDLDLAQAALLAGIIQSPNRLSPVRHPGAARKRRDRVLTRLEELGWAGAEEARRARGRPLGISLDPPHPRRASHFLAWVAQGAEEEAPRWVGRGRGVVVQTSLDPYLQEVAEGVVADGLAELRRSHPRLRRAPLSAALVALDGATGEVLAYVGGDPGEPGGGFDRARSAHRQPGSTVKPLVLLEAFARCGGRRPLSPATRVADEPLRLDLPTGPWEPTNADGAFAGVMDLRTALVESRNVPFVRVARWCGFEDTARRMRRAGLTLPEAPPPSFVLGAVEVSPLELARAYTAFADAGRSAEPRPLVRLERPGGRRLARQGPRTRKVTDPASAYLVRDLMRGAVETGTARPARLPGLAVAAKTGTSSESRDAWLAGEAEGLVTVVWVGLDDGSPLGLSGARAAAPLWRRFMAAAALTRPRLPTGAPRGVVRRYVDPATGLLVRSFNPRARRELFRRGALPPRDRFFRIDRPLPVVR